MIDTDLRWRIVTALAASGDLDADGVETPFIDAEAKTDPTAAGRRNAAAASAARPQAAVKDAAWRQVVEDDTLANITARAIIGGFVRPGQGEVLAPFTQRYFDTIRQVWERRSSEVAQTVVVGLYPSGDISQSAVDAADAFLADPDVPPALRRLVLEGRAGVERSLRAQAFDARLISHCRRPTPGLASMHGGNFHRGLCTGRDCGHRRVLVAHAHPGTAAA